MDITSGKESTQIDYELLRETFRKHVWDVKIISGEEIAKQHSCWFVISFLTFRSPLRRNSSLA